MVGVSVEQVLDWGDVANEQGREGALEVVTGIIRAAGGTISSGSAECVLESAQDIAFNFNLVQLLLQGRVIARRGEDGDFKLTALLSPSDVGDDKILNLTEKGWRSRVRPVPSG